MPDPVTGTLGVIGVGGSLLSSSNNKKAINAATEAQTDASAQQIALARETRDLIRSDNEPFRALELQRANALGEVFGFNPSGDTQAQTQAAPTPQRFIDFLQGSERQEAGGGNFSDFLRNPMDGVFGNRLGVTGTTGLIEIPSQSSFPTVSSVDVAPQSSGINTGAQSAALTRFEGSPFGDIFSNNFGLETDAIDAGLAGQGLNLSSVRTEAKEDARQRNFGSAFGNYLNALSGFPTSGAATTANANAAQNFSNTAGNAYGAAGAATANGAYARAQNNNALLNNVSGSFGTILGGF